MYDVIIVGARVAGAATAMLLARSGLRVLAVDRAAFPSDTLSTHQVQVPAVARLARWGVLDTILEAGTPPTRSVEFHQGPITLSGTMPRMEGVDFMFSPRRTRLDLALADAARAAGAEVRERFTVEQLLVEDGVVAGIRGQERGGTPVIERARLVVGADGRHSIVARQMEAPSYRLRPAQTIAFYTYWADVPVKGGEMYGLPGVAVGLWPTDDGLVMSYLARPAAGFAEFRADVEGNFLRALDEVGVGERFRAGRRAERFRGTPDVGAFLRKPYGKGWALVGDAGMALDPITGHGIADAFRDADLLATAIVGAGSAGAGGWSPALSRALAGYQRARDKAAIPMYDVTARIAGLAAPAPAEVALFEAVARRPEATDLFFAALTGAVPLRRFMSPANVIRLVGVRGLARLARAPHPPA
jgi:flavin-dependent dehydrogenase